MLRIWQSVLLLFFVSVTVAAQAPEPPLADTRLTVNTLVREDIFAGFLRNDTSRLARAEKNMELLLASRPAERATLLAWQGSAALTRAVLAHEANQPDAFREQYARAEQLFADAMRLDPDGVAPFAIAGGTNAMIADRLPTAERSAGWERAYAAYQRLWQMQRAIIDKLPLHHKGEVLAGLAESAQRTGRVDEVDGHLERILAATPDTAYATRARQWKETANARATNKLTCQTCHGPGTLAARLAEVGPR